MKKVININFHGRVVPIEESAYEILKQYVDSLKKYFANEEGKDEIINDIESRIAELFAENIKKGQTCITEDTVESIIKSMGRPEDFEAEDISSSETSYTHQNYSQDSSSYTSSTPRTRLYRSENDKVLGGVCAGLANYLRVDATVVRILFAIITFGGFGTGFLIYILMWVIIPSKELESNLKKRLFRNPEERVIAGVASGLAAYFNIQVWIPRLIFALPLVLGILGSITHSIFWNFDFGPSFIFGSFGGSLSVIYAILWAIIPEANTASEKLEMRGEKVDLNTIKNTIQEDLEGFKNRASKMGSEIKEKAEKFGEELKDTVHATSQSFKAEAAPKAKSAGRKIGNVIAVLFKAFFLFLGGIICFAFLMAFIGIAIGGVAVFPLKDFFIEGFWQNLFAWLTFILLLLVPVIAMITWIIRRIMGVKSKNRYLGLSFTLLWVLGIVSAVLFASSFINNFRGQARDKQEYTITQPTSSKIILRVVEPKIKMYNRFYRMDGFVRITNDSLYLNNLKVNVTKSFDANYHITAFKYSGGNSENAALEAVKDINYSFNQADSVINLNNSFALEKGSKFRNQRIILQVQVPVGKRIYLDRSISRKFDWVNMHFGNDWENEWGWDDDNLGKSERWRSNIEYVMTESGLERIDKRDYWDDSYEYNDPKEYKEELQKDIDKKERELEQKKKELEKTKDSTYKYNQTLIKKEKLRIKNNASFIHVVKDLKQVLAERFTG
jgi:phage shock protein PspC (stress-responsive transcriptional regulator)